ncbi:MAG: 4-hydroxy-3-methylbut-2-enyl diphosphate reductase [Treponema sp.]|nr:4-hydroxy-3-methylbut-2-enyl diphosphate reductase [Treponema sp.]
MGVRRAVEMAAAAVSAAPSPQAGSSIYTMGPLIHNPQVLASLAKQGIIILEEADLFAGTDGAGFLKPLSGSVVIIRAHGVSPGIEQVLRERGAQIINATCPRVKAIQNAALALAKKGYRAFLAGEKDHAEVKGIYGYCLEGSETSETPCIIVGNPEEADSSARELRETAGGKTLPVKTALIGQSTISEGEYNSIAEAVKRHFPDLEVKNTICGATRDRQDALRELCSAAEAVVIAGGKESANTRRLLSIAQSCGKPAWLAESVSDLPEEAKAFNVIGLSAGASTPDSVIDEIERALL